MGNAQIVIKDEIIDINNVVSFCFSHKYMMAFHEGENTTANSVFEVVWVDRLSSG